MTFVESLTSLFGILIGQFVIKLFSGGWIVYKKLYVNNENVFAENNQIPDITANGLKEIGHVEKQVL